MNRLGQATLADAAIGVMIASVVIGAVGIPVAQDALVTDTVAVTNETVASSGSTPELLTLDEAEDGVLDNDRLTVFVNNDHDGSSVQLPSGNFTTLPDNTDPDLNITSATDINSTGDTYNVTYDGKPQGFIGGTAGTIAEFVIVGMALSLFVAAISLVS